MEEGAVYPAVEHKYLLFLYSSFVVVQIQSFQSKPTTEFLGNGQTRWVRAKPFDGFLPAVRTVALPSLATWKAVLLEGASSFGDNPVLQSQLPDSRPLGIWLGPFGVKSAVLRHVTAGAKRSDSRAEIAAVPWTETNG